jgi:hypothetical protein
MFQLPTSDRVYLALQQLSLAETPFSRLPRVKGEIVGCPAV